MRALFHTLPENFTNVTYQAVAQIATDETKVTQTCWRFAASVGSDCSSAATLPTSWCFNHLLSGPMLLAPNQPPPAALTSCLQPFQIRFLLNCLNSNATLSQIQKTAVTQSCWGPSFQMWSSLYFPSTIAGASCVQSKLLSLLGREESLTPASAAESFHILSHRLH